MNTTMITWDWHHLKFFFYMNAFLIINLLINFSEECKRCFAKFVPGTRIPHSTKKKKRKHVLSLPEVPVLWFLVHNQDFCHQEWMVLGTGLTVLCVTTSKHQIKAHLLDFLIFVWCYKIFLNQNDREMVLLRLVCSTL